MIPELDDSEHTLEESMEKLQVKPLAGRRRTLQYSHRRSSLRELRTRSTITPAKKADRVSFADNLVTSVHPVPPASSYDLKELRKIWLVPKDFKSIRVKAKASAKSAQMEGRLAMGGIDDGYRKAMFLAVTLDEGDVEPLLKDVNKHIVGLRGWCCRRDTCRGVEHWTSRKHWHNRNEVMTEARQVVVELTRFKENPDEISRQYQDYSRSARILARMLGEADCFAAGAPDDEMDTPLSPIRKQSFDNSPRMPRKRMNI